jgi:hypothetical protein
MLEILDIYGMESKRGESYGGGSRKSSCSVDRDTLEDDGFASKECVICYTENRDTVVLPCRHLCLCYKCAQIVRMQSNKCPLCRTRMSSFIFQFD